MKKIVISTIAMALSLSVHAQKECSGNTISNVSILLDLSEPLDQPSTIAYNTFSRRIIEILPSGGKLNVYTIKLNAEDVNKKPDFEVCIPDFDKMKGEIYRNRAKKKFEDQVLPKLEKLGSVITSAKKSPILENIFKISHSTFLQSGLAPNQRLIVISDMIQFSELADFYKDIPSYSLFASTPKASSWLPRVNPVKLNLIILNSSSSNKLDLKKIRGFWLDYSKNNFKPCGFSGINDVSVSFKNDC